MSAAQPHPGIHRSIDVRIQHLAAQQHGVFSRDQVAALGGSAAFIRHRVTSGRWKQHSSDAFTLVGVPRTWRMRLMVAALSWGDSSAISHASAAALHRLAGFQPGAVDITVPRNRRRSYGNAVLHRNRLEAIDVQVVDAIPVTTVARTLIDVASVAPRRTVGAALDDALRRGLVSLPRLQWRMSALGSVQGRPGIPLMRELMKERYGRGLPENYLESYVLDLIRGDGLPEPVVQHKLYEGKRVWARIDLAYPDAMIAIETEGHGAHSGRDQWLRDRKRLSKLMKLGWLPHFVTWDDAMLRPAHVVDEIRALLEAVGRHDPPGPRSPAG